MWGIFALLLAFTVFFLMFRRLTQEKVDVSKGPFSLQKRPEVAKSETTRQLVNSTNTGTIQAFVYPLQAQKTGTLTLCSPSGTSNPGEPDCSTGQYNMCKCVGADCSKCTHSGYVNVMNISNVIRVELLAAPDAGRPNAASAQLVVRTVGMASQLVNGCIPKSTELPVRSGDEAFLGSTRLCCDVPLVNGECPSRKGPADLKPLCRTGDVPLSGDANTDFWASWFNSNIKVCDTPDLPKVQTVFEETIPLPEIPFQKWTFLTIAREGRRFDIYYNGKIVMSKRTQNVMDTRAAFGPITAGDPNLIGKIAFVQTFPQKLTQTEVMANYKANSDTTGQPTLSAPGSIFDYLPNCKDGGCISGPTMRPTSPLLDWQTQYA
jgi:hypothetical protein